MSDDRHGSSEEEAALDARREARAAIPAMYIDTWAMLTWRGHIRIVLGEWIADDPHYRAAFVMELEDAKEFAERILVRVLDRQKKDAAAKKKDHDLAGES